MRCKENRPGTSITPLKFAACLFAFGFVCCSLLSIYWEISPAYASTGLRQTTSNAARTLVNLDGTQTGTPTPTQTSTSTPTPTTTNTPTPTQTGTPAPTPTATSLPSPTVTNTPPSPSPTATAALTPTPTFARSATPTASTQQNGGPTGGQTPIPGGTPVSSVASTSSVYAPNSETGQTQANSLATTSNSADQTNMKVQQSNSSFPYTAIAVAFSSLVLLGSLGILGWAFVRRRLLAMSPSKYPPSGAAPWSRTRNFD